jgi:hypothetical protein
MAGEENKQFYMRLRIRRTIGIRGGAQRQLFRVGAGPFCLLASAFLFLF